MKQFIGAFVIIGFALTASVASTQESGGSAGRVEVSAFPGGGILFTQSSSGSDFTNYALGGSLTYNFNRFVGVEGEGGGTFGIDQKLDLRAGRQSAKPPNTLGYSGNAIVYPTGNNRAFVPYATGGIGGLTLFDRRQLGVNDTTTFLTGDAGGGVILPERPIGRARRLPVLRGPPQRRCAVVLRSGDAVRSPGLRRDRAQRPSVTRRSAQPGVAGLRHTEPTAPGRIGERQCRASRIEL